MTFIPNWKPSRSAYKLIILETCRLCIICIVEPQSLFVCRPKLYFVKLDVQACFDTIEQSKLLQILKDLITEVRSQIASRKRRWYCFKDAYCIQRYGQVSAVAGKIQRKYVKKACPQDEQPHFLEYAAELAHVLRNIIFVDQVGRQGYYVDQFNECIVGSISKREKERRSSSSGGTHHWEYSESK